MLNYEGTFIKRISPLPWLSRMGKDAALLAAICELSVFTLRVLKGISKMGKDSGKDK